VQCLGSPLFVRSIGQNLIPGIAAALFAGRGEDHGNLPARRINLDTLNAFARKPHGTDCASDFTQVEPILAAGGHGLAPDSPRLAKPVAKGALHCAAFIARRLIFASVPQTLGLEVPPRRSSEQL